jgi:tyrosinase
MSIQRRTFLQLVSVGAVTVFSGKLSFAYAQRPTRRTLLNMPLDADDISTYRDFVQMMLDKDQTKPLSWLGYSLQHGDYNDGYNFCPHGDWYFLPWHREYVLMYERAARVLTNNNDFAMPYWDWTNMRDYPEAFANPTYKGKANPLYVANRNPLTGDNALTDDIVGQQQVIDHINNETVYEAFGTSRNADQTDDDPSWVPAGGGSQGILERNPHNTIHNNIGVYMPSAGSPRDPIFFMHHCNIDHIWAYWNGLGRANSTDPLWLNMVFTNNYLDPTGQPYSRTVSDLLNIENLGYTYDALPPAPSPTPNTTDSNRLLAMLHSKAGTVPAGVEALATKSAISASAIAPFHADWSLSAEKLTAMSPSAVNQPKPHVYAMIRGITLGNHCRGVRVFLNLPDVTPAVPNSDPHFVATFTFLAHGAGHRGAGKNAGMQMKESPSVLVNLTDTLQRLSAFKRVKPGQMTVQLIPIPAPGVLLDDVGPVTATSIEIVTL